MIATTPNPPYYAVIFTAQLTDFDQYFHEMNNRMILLAMQHPGFLGVESSDSNCIITVSYWDSLESIKAWRENAEHSLAQEGGYKLWFSKFKVRVSRVERDYSFDHADAKKHYAGK